MVAGFCLAIAATFFFGYQAGRTARLVRRHDRRQNGSRENEPIKSWMSVPFVAHTHHTPEEVLFQAIRVAPNPRDHRPIRDIARAEKVPVANLIRDLQMAIADAGHASGAAAPPSGKAP